MSHSSYDRTHDYSEEMSTRAYNSIIGLILLIGFGVNAFMARYLTESIMQIQLSHLLIGYFVICIAGILMSELSDNPFVSFIGYLMVVIPCGAVIAISIEDVSVDVVVHAATTTFLMTAIMLICGTIWPEFFENRGRVLLTCLSAIIVIELIACLVFNGAMPTFWHHLVVALFCLYIGYDWAKAQDEERTLDNAVDACVGLYLDIINIFLRLIPSDKDKNRK